MVVEPVFDPTSRTAQAGGWDWTSSLLEGTVDPSSLTQTPSAGQTADSVPSASSGESPPPSYAQAQDESSRKLEAWFNRALSLYGSTPLEDPLESLSHLYRSMLAFTPQERQDGRLRAREHRLERQWESIEMSAVMSHLNSGWSELGEDDVENLREEIERTRRARMVAEPEMEALGRRLTGRGRERGWGSEVIPVPVPGLERSDATLGGDILQADSVWHGNEHQHEVVGVGVGVETSLGWAQAQEPKSAVIEGGRSSCISTLFMETFSTVANIASSAVLPTAAILAGLLVAEHRAHRSDRDDSLVTLTHSLLAISDLARSVAGSDVWESVTRSVAGSDVWESVSKGWTEGLGDAARLIARTAASGIGETARAWMEGVSRGWAG